jgi:hypothetical protein
MYQKAPRGFESLPFRHTSLKLRMAQPYFVETMYGRIFPNFEAWFAAIYYK